MGQRSVSVGIKLLKVFPRLTEQQRDIARYPFEP
jgi:hypothetical protein